jgi:Gram-negative bacterial TonB protein C-terminal
MIRILVLMFALPIISTTAAQTVGNEKQQVEQHGALRLEHADVPMYPQVARTLRIYGTVEVRVTVKDGNVVNTEVKSGPRKLVDSTVDNIKGWRFNRLDHGTFTTKFVYQLEMKGPIDPNNARVELQLPFLAKITAVPVILDTQGGLTK